MNKNDLMFFGFVTLWIILTAGKPDVLDGITSLLMQDSCDVKRLEVLKGEQKFGNQHKILESSY